MTQRFATARNTAPYREPLAEPPIARSMCQEAFMVCPAVLTPVQACWEIYQEAYRRAVAQVLAAERSRWMRV